MTRLSVLALIVAATSALSMQAQQQPLVRGSLLRVASVDIVEAMKHSDEFREGKDAMKAEIALAEAESAAKAKVVLQATPAKVDQTTANRDEFEDWRKSVQRQFIAKDRVLYERTLTSITQAITQFSREHTIQVVIPIAHSQPKPGTTGELLNTHIRSVQYQDPEIPIDDITPEIIVLINQSYHRNKIP
ncbi:MAG: hypothetical protein SH850_15175 [Planctomycetaceae bacterium]|nr:hypothetical protein [Planctomycetaceae bacterium]